MVTFLVLFGFTINGFMKDTKAIAFLYLSNFQALLTNQQICDKMGLSHNLIFFRVSGKLPLVKGVSFFPHTH